MATYSVKQGGLENHVLEVGGIDVAKVALHSVAR